MVFGEELWVGVLQGRRNRNRDVVDAEYREAVDWTPERRASAVEESQRFIESVVFDDDAGTFADLLTSSRAFVDDELAPIYGVAPTGDWQRVELPPEQRRPGEDKVALLRQSLYGPRSAARN